MSSETEILQAILRRWGNHPRLTLWRQNTGVAKFGSRVVRFGLPGVADLIGFASPGGRFVAIEVKSPTGKQSPEQKNFQAVVEARGGVYILARSLEDTDVLERILDAKGSLS